MNKTSFSKTISLTLADRLQKDLKKQGFELSQPEYTVFRAMKKGLSVTLYQSGKLLAQGKELKEFLEFYLEPEILQDFSFTHQNTLMKEACQTASGHIGIDESGKGDFFGPLCIAGVFAEGAALLKLHEIGVKDSKALNDSEILKIGKKIIEHVPYHIVRISPAKYNELYKKFNNLNTMLAWGHATTIEALYEKTGCKDVLIDQFARESVVIEALKRKKLKLNLTQRHKGEEDIVVAAASILARMTFVQGLAELEKQFECKLPKGASQGVIRAGVEFARRYGKAALENVAKLHFKTLEAITVKI